MYNTVKKCLKISEKSTGNSKFSGAPPLDPARGSAPRPRACAAGAGDPPRTPGPLASETLEPICVHREQSTHNEPTCTQRAENTMSLYEATPGPEANFRKFWNM